MPKQATLNKEEKELNKLVDSYKKHINDKGDIECWTDNFLVAVRDKFRKVARITRGYWTFDFYESLQAINKESIKRDLSPETK
jgi:hypothetical protein